MEPIIFVDSLVKRYKQGQSNAVDDITFQVAPGSFFALLGPNGAGKTTTISILTTTLLPTSGKVVIGGFDTVRQASKVRREIGIIFQKPSLDLNLSGEENIRFHAVLYGLYRFRPSYRTMPPVYRKQVEELTGILGIGADLFKPVKTYSGGMKRKLEIVRSLMHHPRVLFLDEPTSGLDAASRHNLWEYIRTMQQEIGTTVFLTTHYLEEAEGADSVCIINHGKIVSRGTPAQIKADLIEEYVLVDAADRNRLRDELKRLNLPFVETPLAPFKVGLDGRNVYQTIKVIETPLTVVQTHTPSLEDAYLEIVGRAS